MSLLDEPEFQGNRRLDFLWQNFLLITPREEQIAILLHEGISANRKAATDKLNGMRRYWIDGERTGRARPGHDAIQAFFSFKLRGSSGDSYRVVSGSAAKNDVEFRLNAFLFTPRLSSQTDEINSIVAYLSGYELQAIAYVYVFGSQALVYISNNSQ